MYELSAQAAFKGETTSPRDFRLTGVLVSLLGIGMIMMASASVTVAENRFGDPLYYLKQQMIALMLGLALGFACLRVPMYWWQRLSAFLLILSYILLCLVLVPGIGTEINGSTRWIRFAGLSFQISEPVKFFVLAYLAAYLVRQNRAVRQHFHGLFRPVLILTSITALLLLQPDFGAGVVLFTTALGMVFLAGAPALRYFVWATVPLAALTTLAICSPYRMQRLTSFIDPWQDPYGNGFQLTQALIAFGRGEFFGLGIGNGVQKLFYLPEAHTDFMFAVLAEELGLLGSVTVIILYLMLVWRAFAIGKAAEQDDRPFSAFFAYGIGLLTGIQAFINIGVNMGVLPTKGLTLPLMSYGGNSLIVFCMLSGVLLRVEYENRHVEEALTGKRKECPDRAVPEKTPSTLTKSGWHR